MEQLFNQQYIEKCIKNPDLQSLWNLQVGNYYFNTQQNKLYLIDKSFTGVKDDKKFWIPRQDEIQILMREKLSRYRKMNDLKFDFTMRKCIFQMYCNKILAEITLNDMWLTFFMQKMFGRYWLPERKEWIKQIFN